MFGLKAGVCPNPNISPVLGLTAIAKALSGSYLSWISFNVLSINPWIFLSIVKYISAPSTGLISTFGMLETTFPHASFA